MSRQGIDRLRGVSLFDGLKASDLKRLSEFLREVTFRQHHYIFHEGTDGHTLYVILDGHVKIEHSDPRSGRRNTLAILSPGDCFGEIAIVSDINRTAAARAVTPCVLLIIEENDFLDLITTYPLVAKNMMKAMAAKLFHADQLIESLIFKNLEARLAGKILELADKFGQEQDGGAIEIGIALSHFDLAELVGTNRETITRILGVLKADGGIALERKKIIVMNRRKLQAWVK